MLAGVGSLAPQLREQQLDVEAARLIAFRNMVVDRVEVDVIPSTEPRITSGPHFTRQRDALPQCRDDLVGVSAIPLRQGTEKQFGGLTGDGETVNYVSFYDTDGKRHTQPVNPTEGV